MIKELVKELEHNNNVQQPNFKILNTVGGSSIMGVIEKELDDSFLVKLPARLVSLDGVVSAEAYTDVICMRFFKYTLFALAPLFGDFEAHYLRYITSTALKKFPDAVSEEDKAVIEKRLEELSVGDEPFKDINADEAVINGFLMPGNNNVTH